jgi:hypothetical protein
MVVVENLKQKTIKKVIDDMVNDFCVEDYFEKL